MYLNTKTIKKEIKGNANYFLHVKPYNFTLKGSTFKELIYIQFLKDNYLVLFNTFFCFRIQFFLNFETTSGESGSVDQGIAIKSEDPQLKPYW